MREILFRGKSKSINKGEWTYGSFVEDTDLNACCIRDKSLVYELVDRETVGQFTGLTDKKGKKIFEGDIVEISWKGNVICVGDIRYDEASCRFVIYEDYIFPYGFDNTTTFEVIGNIYDNKELLEELK